MPSPTAIAAFRQMQQLACCCDPDPHSPICKPCRDYWRLHDLLEAEFGFRAAPIVAEPTGGPLTPAQQRYMRLAEAAGRP
jgi:hypothetical protein